MWYPVVMGILTYEQAMALDSTELANAYAAAEIKENIIAPKEAGL